VTVDPYLKSLQENYYYPLASITMTTPDTDTDFEDASSSPDRQFTQTSTILPKPTVVTVEDSLEVIDELVQELKIHNEEGITTPSLIQKEELIDQANHHHRTVTSMRFSVYRLASS
jgi:hypothetical protein